MPAMTIRVDPVLTSSQSRRVAIQAGGLLVAIGALALPVVVRAQATPAAEGSGAGMLLVQSFSKGSLFPTQGDVGVPPYTLILWDAADRGFFTIAAADLVASFAPTNALIISIEAGERPQATVVVPASLDGSRPEQAWSLRLVYGGLGADPGAVTYQGEPVEETEASASLGMTAAALPDGPQELAGGYLVIAGLTALDLPEGERVRFDLA
jgi:hypothetical protein